MKRKILTLVSVAATVIATLMASSACFLFGYQPEEPECLSKD